MPVSARRAATLAAVIALALTAVSARAETTALTIAEAVREALAANPAVAAGRAQMDASGTEVTTARLRPNPELNVETVNVTRSLAYSEETEYAGGISYQVEAPGKRRSRIEVAKRSRASAQWQFADEIRELTLAVQTAAVDLLLADANLELTRSSLDALRRIVDISEARHRVGDLDGLEMRRSRLELRRFINEARQLELDQQLLRAQLQQLLGRDPEQPPLSLRDDFRRSDTLPDYTSLRARVLLERPDLSAAQEELARAEADVRNQEVQRRPDVTVGTEMRRFREAGNYVGVMLSVPLPVFDRNQGEIARARAERQAAAANLRAAQLTVEYELRNAYEALRVAREQLDAIDTGMLEDARRVLEVTEFSYRRGESSLIELLDANMVFNETMRDHNEARAGLAQALYQLDAVTAVTEAH